MTARKPLRCRMGWHRWPRPRRRIYHGERRICACCGLRQIADVDQKFNLLSWEDEPAERGPKP